MMMGTSDLQSHFEKICMTNHVVVKHYLNQRDRDKLLPKAQIIAIFCCCLARCSMSLDQVNFVYAVFTTVWL